MTYPIVLYNIIYSRINKWHFPGRIFDPKRVSGPDVLDIGISTQGHYVLCGYNRFRSHVENIRTVEQRLNATHDVPYPIRVGGRTVPVQRYIIF